MLLNLKTNFSHRSFVWTLLSVIFSVYMRTVGDHQDALVLRGWRLSSTTWNPITSPWMKELTWLRIVHSGDWCLHLVQCTPRGACQKWMNEGYLLAIFSRKWTLLQESVRGILKAVLPGGIPSDTQGWHFSDTWRYAGSGVQSDRDGSVTLLHCRTRHSDSLRRRSCQTRGEDCIDLLASDLPCSDFHN